MEPTKRWMVMFYGHYFTAGGGPNPSVINRRVLPMLRHLWAAGATTSVAGMACAAIYKAYESIEPLEFPDYMMEECEPEDDLSFAECC